MRVNDGFIYSSGDHFRLQSMHSGHDLQTHPNLTYSLRAKQHKNMHVAECIHARMFSMHFYTRTEPEYTPRCTCPICRFYIAESGMVFRCSDARTERYILCSNYSTFVNAYSFFYCVGFFKKKWTNLPKKYMRA